jgi:hypothetical protein
MPPSRNWIDVKICLQKVSGLSANEPDTTATLVSHNDEYPGRGLKYWRDVPKLLRVWDIVRYTPGSSRLPDRMVTGSC